MSETTRAPKKKSPPLREQWATLKAKFDALSRPKRWLVMGIIVVLCYLAVDDVSWRVARDWETDGDRIEAALRRSRDRDALVSADLQHAVAVFGPVEPPGRNGEGHDALATAINEVLRKHHVAGSSFDSRSGQRMKDPDTVLFGSSGLDRLQAEVKFEADAKDLPKILAELESHPDIESISALRLQKNDAAHRISVQATIEAWVQASRSKRSQ